MYISGSDGSVEVLNDDQEDDMAQVIDTTGKAKQGKSFDNGSFVNMGDRSMDNNENVTRILSTNPNQSRSNSGHSSS